MQGADFLFVCEQYTYFLLAASALSNFSSAPPSPDGRTFIKTLSKSGVEKSSVVKIPAYETKDERDSIICELSADFVQDDIADMLDISQGTVSNALKKRKNKKK